MTTYIEKQEKQQRRIFHALASRMGMTEEQRRQILMDNFGVESSSDLNSHQLTDLIYSMEKLANPAAHATDKWRKRVIASIAAYLTELRQEANLSIIKSIACRATKYDDFNRIPVERLRSLYNAFMQRTKDMKTVDELTYELLLKPRPIK